MAPNAPTRSDDPLLRFNEARDYLRVSRTTMFRLMARGELKAHKVGGTYRFRLSNLELCVKAA